MSFADLGLMPELLRAVEDAGYTQPTPIQSEAIPVVLSGRDVMGGAQTGTGKTAGFTLPLLQRLAPHANSSTSPARHPVRALVLAPTRELAMQVHESVLTYAKHLPLRATCIYGGVDMRAQMEILRGGVEIVVATPGRLLDHVQQKSIQLNQVQMLVLDEADRMLDMGFIPDIRRILAMLPAKRQSLLFSATFSNEIKKLADQMLNDPQLIEVARRNTVSETIEHQVYPVSAHSKRNLLAHLLKNEVASQVLVFVDTKFGCSRLTHYLNNCGIPADAIHGDKSQQQRTEALDGFKNGTTRVLVATDVAARGIDIDDLPMVINYVLPNTAEDYVHRIGRTGRAGKQGKAISLVSPEEKGRLADIEKLIKLKIPQHTVTGFESGPAGADEDRGRGRGRDRDRDRDRERRSERDNTGRRSRSAPKAASTVAPDGFDYSRPYEPAADNPSGNAGKPEAPKRGGKRPVAFLLGGAGRKT
ncbi:DEAD/DEAH box helicase [Nitrogeniibacter mangrovi]|uniref:DEAD-box ATP-dependent RNA helicase RhpA n=1 Tax=Nitrogeniibacter mangrovi TaxID=2016596 RepID=A0A6C1B4U7_9RHOO|nr:DEAD/DEAH box helicase [Nitrogeniibacter mangrovi]QID18711.1 DEAD/DEAH box helicase [Nitrogeniibacter mangrovi]